MPKVYESLMIEEDMFKDVTDVLKILEKKHGEKLGRSFAMRHLLNLGLKAFKRANN